MRTFVIVSFAAAALLAACREQPAENQANALIPSAETRTAGEEPDTLAAGPVDAETAKRLMHERHEGMEEIGDETKRINDQLKSSSPDVARIQQSAAKIAELAPKAQTWFPAGTGPDVGKTRAKPEIWQTPEDFAAKAREFDQAAQAFNAAAQSGDLGRIRSAFESLGKACKACHDSYRAPEKD